MNITREIRKAYLFLCTADSAVKNLSCQVAATKAGLALEKYYSQRMIGIERLATEEDDLKIWKERLLEAQVAFVKWAACRAMGGKTLPPEIASMIRSLMKPPWYII